MGDPKFKFANVAEFEETVDSASQEVKKLLKK
jgi:hypothetical protein